MLLSFLSILIQGLPAAPASTACQEPVTVNPIWTRTVESGVEWCAPVGGEPATVLLVCSKKAQLSFIDLRDGESRWPEPVAVQPGVQFAGETHHVGYACGPSQVYAFRSGGVNEEGGGRSGLLWQVAGAPAAHTVGDPEFLTRIVAAQATPNGVMIVRSDGRVAELRRKNGSAPWTHKVPAIANCRLHVHGDFAALLSKRGEAFSVMFYDLRPDPPRPVRRTVNETPPIWTTLIDEGLVAVWRDRFALIPMDGEPRYHTLHTALEARASTLAVYTGAAGPSPRPARPESSAGPVLILFSESGFPRAYDVRTGQLRWPDENALELPIQGEPARTLRVSGDRIVATGDRWFGLWRADGGSLVAREVWLGDAIGAGASGELAYGLFVDSSQRLRLVRCRISGDAGTAGDSGAGLQRTVFQLGRASRVRATFWPDGLLVVVEDNRLRVYALP
jgi:hypothetical protein